MFTALDAHGNRHAAATRLTPRERRIIRLMMDEDPAFLRRLRSDPRTGRIATRLLRAYRAEMLRDLRERVGSSVEQAAAFFASLRSAAR